MLCRPNASQTVNQGADTPSVSSDRTPGEAARATSDCGSLVVLAFSTSVSTGIGADLVAGSLSWGDQIDLADNELSPFSASEPESSLGSHVSPSLNMPSCANMDKDSNGMNVIDSNEMNIIDTNNSISNLVMSNSNSSQTDDNGNLSSSQNDCSNRSQSILSDQNESSVTCVSNAPSGSSGGDLGPVKDAAVTMDTPILGKRAISEIVIDGKSSAKGAAPAPKNDSGSRSKKAASSEVKVIPWFCNAQPFLRITLRHLRWRWFYPRAQEGQTRATFAELKLLFVIRMPQIGLQPPGVLSKNNKMKKNVRHPEVCRGVSLRGHRVVELNVFAEALDGGCEACGSALRLSNCIRETVSGLGSLLYICCSNSECGETNICRTNKTHRRTGTTQVRPIFHVNTKLAAGLKYFPHLGIHLTSSQGFNKLNQHIYRHATRRHRSYPC